MTRRRRSLKSNSSKSVSLSELIAASLVLLVVMALSTSGKFWLFSFTVEPQRFMLIGVLILSWLMGFSVLLVLRTRRKRLAKEILAAQTERFRLSSTSLRHLTYTEFEHEVAWVVGSEVSGCTTRVIGGSGDKGVDVEMYDSASKLRGVIQVKHRSDAMTAIPPSVIREMDSVKVRSGVELTYIVTNARFSEDSYALARHYGIVLLDGVRFERHRRCAYAKFYAAHADKSTPVSGEPPALVQLSVSPASAVQSRLPSQIDSIQQQLEERRKRLNVS